MNPLRTPTRWPAALLRRLTPILALCAGLVPAPVPADGLQVPLRALPSESLPTPAPVPPFMAPPEVQPDPRPDLAANDIVSSGTEKVLGSCVSGPNWGVLPVLVINARLTSRPSLIPPSQDDVRAYWSTESRTSFGGGGNVKDWFTEMSFGKIDIEATVTETVDLDSADEPWNHPGDCNSNFFLYTMPAAVQKASQLPAHYDESQFCKVVLHMPIPFGLLCNDGVAESTCGRYAVVGDRYVFADGGETAHELTHLLCPAHSESLFCAGNCGSPNEFVAVYRHPGVPAGAPHPFVLPYGDPFTLMGSSLWRPDNGLGMLQWGLIPPFMREQLQIFPLSATRVVTTPSTIQLAPYEVDPTPASLVEQIRVPTPFVDYLVDNADGLGSDWFNNVQTTNPPRQSVMCGVLVRASDPIYGEPLLLDMRPQCWNGTMPPTEDAALPYGYTYVDGDSRISIRVGPGQCQLSDVHVDFGSNTPPTLSDVHASPTFCLGQTIRLFATYHDPDQFDCGSAPNTICSDPARLGSPQVGRVTFKYGTSAPPALTAFSQFVEDGQVAWVDVSAPSTPQALVFDAQAQDAAGGVSAVSPDQLIAPNSPPNTPTLVAPPDGARLPAPVTFTATYSDPNPGDLGLVEFEICNSSGCVTVQSNTATMNPQDLSVTPPLAAGRNYTWHARCLDSCGAVSPWSSRRSVTIVLATAGCDSWIPVQGTGLLERTGSAIVALPTGDALVLGGVDGSGLTARVDLFNRVTGTWTRLSDMPRARKDFTATLMRDGSVFVAGGADASGNPLITAQVFRLGLGWGPELNMPEARTLHAAVLAADGNVYLFGGLLVTGLPTDRIGEFDGSAVTDVANLSFAAYHVATALMPSGQIYVCGGLDGNSTALTDAVLFDPNFKTVTAQPSLQQARALHTATALQDGSVLVAGGLADPDYMPLATAEIEHPLGPATVLPLMDARYSHSAALLPDGRVLLAGGNGDRTFASNPPDYLNIHLATAEVVDAASGTSTPVATLPEVHEDPESVVLPDGTVLVYGGMQTTSAALYQSGCHSVVPAGAMGTTRVNFTSTLLNDGTVLVCGGHAGSATLSSAEIFNPLTRAWTPTGSMPSPREGHTATLLPDGTVLVLGGTDGNSFPNSAFVYDPASRSWGSTANPLGTPRSSHRSVRMSNGEVLVVGGINTQLVGACEIYNWMSRTFRPTGSLLEPRWRHTATLLPGGTVMACGGYRLGGYSTTAELFDPTSGTWSQQPGLQSPRWLHEATLLGDGSVMVSGGFNGSTALATGEVWTMDSPTMGHFHAVGDLHVPRGWHRATELQDGRVLISGGSGGGLLDPVLQSLEIYEPRTGQYRIAGAAAERRRFHEATLLRDGTVLLVGGRNESNMDLASSEGDDADGTPDPSWLPTLGTLTPSASPGGIVTASGTQFTGHGFTEASGGSSLSAAANQPILVLRREDSTYTAAATSTSWTDSNLRAVLPLTLLPGTYQARVVVDGIPSDALTIQVQ